MRPARRRPLAVGLVSCVCAVAACATATAGAPTFPRPLPHSTLAAYLRVGGLAGFDDLLVVGRHGRVTVNRAHDPHALRGKLSSGELAKLRLQIAAAHLAHARSRPEHGCCDMIDIWIYASGHAVRNAPETGGPVNSLGQHLQRILDRTITAATPG